MRRAAPAAAAAVAVAVAVAHPTSCRLLHSQNNRAERGSLS